MSLAFRPPSDLLLSPHSRENVFHVCLCRYVSPLQPWGKEWGCTGTAPLIADRSGMVSAAAPQKGFIILSALSFSLQTPKGTRQGSMFAKNRRHIVIEDKVGQQKEIFLTGFLSNGFHSRMQICKDEKYKPNRETSLIWPSY